MNQDEEHLRDMWNTLRKDNMYMVGVQEGMEGGRARREEREGREKGKQEGREGGIKGEQNRERGKQEESLFVKRTTNFYNLVKQ